VRRHRPRRSERKPIHEPLSQRLAVSVTRLLQKVHPRLPRLTRIVLRRLYGFDPWHTSVFSERAYARGLVAYLNAKPPDERGSVVEIGCGLGDILRRARYATRVGLDRDQDVLRAAALLSRLGRQRGIQFATFDFPVSSLSGRYDVIVMVNWIHGVDPSTLVPQLQAYFATNLSERGEIIVDTVADPAYRHNHRIDELTKGLPCLVRRIGDFERGRTLHAIGRPPAHPPVRSTVPGSSSQLRPG
jgi:SAM-dependent methyltransferase